MILHRNKENNFFFQVPFQTLEGILSHVITRLEVSRLYDDVDMIDKDIPAVSLLPDHKMLLEDEMSLVL